jgi:hypothetical protein
LVPEVLRQPTYWTVEDELTGCPEMSAAKNQPKLLNIPEK